MKAYDLFLELYRNNLQFKELVINGFITSSIRFFSEEEWQKITSQNYIAPVNDISNFAEMFAKGYNIGDCVGISWQLSYSYDDVDIVAGIMDYLKGTKNSLNGGHRWLETKDYIIDTSLMLVINKELKEKFGYHEEQRLTASNLKKMPYYQIRKEFVNDNNLKR